MQRWTQCYVALAVLVGFTGNATAGTIVKGNFTGTGTTFDSAVGLPPRVFDVTGYYEYYINGPAAPGCSAPGITCFDGTFILPIISLSGGPVYVNVNGKDTYEPDTSVWSVPMANYTKVTTLPNDPASVTYIQSDIHTINDTEYANLNFLTGYGQATIITATVGEAYGLNITLDLPVVHNSVPEPSTLYLLPAALAVMVGVAKRMNLRKNKTTGPLTAFNA